MSSEKRGSLRVWRGAAILSAATLSVKVMSALYRLPYQNFAGDVGFYVYQQVYSFYALAAALAGAGFPIVISKYIAEAEEGDPARESVQRHAWLALLILCGFLFLALFVFARPLALLIGDHRLISQIRVAAATYLFVPLVALLRGMFQGERENMLPTAWSQVGEQATRVCFILGVSWYLFLNHGDPYQFGMAATAGSAFAPLVTTLILLLFLPGKRVFLRRLLRVRALPVHWQTVRFLLISGCLFSVLSVPLLPFQMIDSMTLLRLLNTLHFADPRAAKGIYDRAYILTQFGMIASTSLTAAIVPRLARLAALRRHSDFQMEATLALKMSVTFGIAASAGLMMISRDVNIMLFRNADGTEAFAIAAWTLLTFSVILTASGVLEAIGKPWLPVIYLLIGAVVKAIGNILLVPHMAIAGGALATLAGTAAAAGLSLAALHRRALIRWLSVQTLFKLLAAVAGMAVTVYLWELAARPLTASFSARPAAAVIALSAAAGGSVVFIGFLYILRFLDSHDLKRLPLPEKFTRGSGSRKL